MFGSMGLTTRLSAVIILFVGLAPVLKNLLSTFEHSCTETGHFNRGLFRMPLTHERITSYEHEIDSSDEEDDSCILNPCLNHGTCTRTKDTYKCHCTEFFTGKYCEKPTNPCNSSICGHGECVLRTTAPYYRCKCHYPYHGPSCNAVSQLCDRNPCKNGGICNITNKGNFSCICPKLYRGKLCEIGALDCYWRDGSTYRGHASQTKHGFTCLPWDSYRLVKEHFNYFTPNTFAHGIGDHNFCRNPDGAEKPWCYFNGANGELSRDTCDVHACGEMLLSNLPFDVKIQKSTAHPIPLATLKPNISVQRIPRATLKPNILVQLIPWTILKPNISIQLIPWTNLKPNISIQLFPWTNLKPNISVQLIPRATLKPNISVKLIPRATLKPNNSIQLIPWINLKPNISVHLIPQATLKPNISVQLIPWTTLKPNISVQRIPQTTIKSNILLQPIPRTTIKPNISVQFISRTTMKPNISLQPIPRTTIKPNISVQLIPRTTMKPNISVQPIPQTTMKPNISFSTCGVKELPINRRGRIIGGNITQPGKYPWLASLQINVSSSHRQSAHVCGGTLISDCWILTAAHCVVSQSQPEAWRVVLGKVDLLKNETYEQILEVEKMIVHEDFRENLQSLHSDIALMKLKKINGKCATETKYVKTACLPDRAFSPGKMCAIAGWGSTETGFTTKLLDANVQIISEMSCSDAKSYGKFLDRSMLCAGDMAGGTDSCKGDSGGPLTCDTDGVHYVAGLVSWGEQCGLKDKPGVYSHVFRFVPWIQRKISENP